MAEAHVRGGLLGRPLHGLGIVGCGGGAGCGTCFLACDALCKLRMKPSASAPGFGVVVLLQLHPSCRFAGTVLVSVLPLAQLFVDCIVPNAPPTRTMSAALGSELVAFPEKVLFTI